MRTPYYVDEFVTLWHGDCIDVLRELPDASVDSIVTDPPYGIAFMGKAWDQPGQFGSQSRRGGTNKQRGDADAALEAGRYDLSTHAMHNFHLWCEAWATECHRILKPGGHLLAFGGARTWHRLAAGIEDAGFEIRDSIAWLFGSGFPKSLNLVDENGDRTGWGTALKPGFEPCVVARKPLAGTVAANVLTHGTGALNIDACRIGTESTLRTKRGGANDFPHEDDEWTPREVVVGSDAGRWPANVVLDESQAADLDAQSGVLNSGTMRAGTERKPRAGGTIYAADTRNFVPSDTYGDSGGASRFFYVAKADSSERVKIDGVAHPTVKPLDLMRWLVRLVTPPGGTVLEPFAGSGTTVEACLLEGFSCVAIEREADYLPLITQRINRRRNPVAAVLATGDDAGLFGLMTGEA